MNDTIINRLKSLRALLDIDSPETRGWAPAVQREVRHVIDAAIDALSAQPAPTAAPAELLRALKVIEKHSVNTLRTNSKDRGDWAEDMAYVGKVARDALAAEPAEPAKPVAWLDEFGNAFPLAAWVKSEVKAKWRPLYTAPPVAQEAAPTDPMDWPLPCDVVVGHGTMRKGVRLGALVSRMKALYEMATGQNADEVAGRSLEQRMAAPGLLQQAGTAQEAAGAVAPSGITAIDRGFRWDSEAKAHIPQLKIEFNAVPGGMPNAEQGWIDRDALAERLAAAPVGLDAKAATEPQYLVMAGGDGFQSSIVPESKLDDAYLLTQWWDLDGIDPDQRAAALAHFHNDDEWTHTDVTGLGDRLEFSLSLEDGWVKVIRLPTAPQAKAAPPATEVQP